MKSLIIYSIKWLSIFTAIAITLHLLFPSDIAKISYWLIVFLFLGTSHKKNKFATEVSFFGIRIYAKAGNANFLLGFTWED